MHIKLIKFFIVYCLITALAFTSCNRDFDSRINTSAVPDTTVHHASSQNKILYVVVDAGIGKVIIDQSVRDNIYPNISNITKTAIFSGASLTDSSNLDATTYADMFTGVRKAKHGVIAATEENNLDEFPSFADNLIAVNANLKTSAFVQSDFIFNNLVKNATEKNLLESDETVKNATASALVTTVSSVVVTQFRAKKAGDASGYGPNSTAYLSALQSFDSFLGSLLNAVKQRATIASENWVVIIASNKGGKYTLGENEDDGSEFSNTERNGFIIISNPNFNLDYYPVPDIRNYSVNGTSPEELGPQDRSGIIDTVSASLYNLGSSGNYTLQFKANFSQRGSLLPSVMSKSSSAAGNSPNLGWAFVLHSDGRNDWDFRLGGKSNTGPVYELGVWNTFTVRIYDSANKRYMRTFLNGAASNSPTDITGSSGTTSSNMVVGGAPSYGAYGHRVRMFDIRIYNVALPENYIKTNYCKTYVNPDEPYTNDLIGYWPGVGINSRESSEKIFLDYSSNKRDMKFSAGAIWSGINITSGATVCTTYPEVEKNKIPYSIDIPRFIYTWLGIFNVEPYRLDGKLITPTYRSTGESN
ncbi:LamG-like jellyroll fold domain-containing protein [Niabella ginsengisoli]|uniref:DUF4983 domain-containing protein n=1 Tax=Niabella ginsengisoli TaxID=522298 RepID=A0ABS9SIW1_9BACT|nr:LamG-like jellyroll fold domain-containing protein [Niabella ginsengisoli]MCH5598303.1 DUF4983 domain-containing protein [Niabella ginsengisoli]